MKQEALIMYFKDLHLLAIAFFLFFVTFVIMTIHIYRKSNRTHYDRMSKLPLTEEAQP